MLICMICLIILDSDRSQRFNEFSLTADLKMAGF